MKLRVGPMSTRLRRIVYLSQWTAHSCVLCQMGYAQVGESFPMRHHMAIQLSGPTASYGPRDILERDAVPYNIIRGYYNSHLVIANWGLSPWLGEVLKQYGMLVLVTN